MKKLSIICLVLAFLSFFSCSARIDGSISADGSASMSINMSLGTRMAGLIKSISDANGIQTDGPILDSAAINSSLSGAPGVAQASLKNTSPTAIEGTVRISKINDFLAGAGGKGFITFEQNNSGGRLSINISRDNSAEIISLLSTDIDDYLNAFMAPFVTGDELTKAEYLELITTFYGKPISDEIAASRVRVSIEFPGNLTSVSGGTYSGKKAELDISLVELLVLETPFKLEAQWR